jgi:hypothetical protein
VAIGPVGKLLVEAKVAMTRVAAGGGHDDDFSAGCPLDAQVPVLLAKAKELLVCEIDDGMKIEYKAFHG